MLPCRGRTCESAWCRRAWVVEHRARIAYGIEHPAAPVYMLTLTAPATLPAGYLSWWEWNGSAPDRWARVWRSLAAAGFIRPAAAYARVWELHQPRGNGGRPLHSHTVLTGWANPRADLEAVRALVVAAGFGSRFRIERVVSVGGMAGYLAGYLSKSHEYLGRRRVVTYSRGWPKDPGRVEELEWRRALNVVDPLIGKLRPGETWWRWAERMADAGSGSLLCDSRAAFAWVRPPGADPPGLFPEVEDGYS